MIVTVMATVVHILQINLLRSLHTRVQRNHLTSTQTKVLRSLRISILVNANMMIQKVALSTQIRVLKSRLHTAIQRNAITAVLKIARSTAQSTLTKAQKNRQTNTLRARVTVKANTPQKVAANTTQRVNIAVRAVAARKEIAKAITLQKVVVVKNTTAEIMVEMITALAATKLKPLT